jgi:hypothetical protein
MEWPNLHSAPGAIMTNPHPLESMLVGRAEAVPDDTDASEEERSKLLRARGAVGGRSLSPPP